MSHDQHDPGRMCGRDPTGRGNDPPRERVVSLADGDAVLPERAQLIREAGLDLRQRESGPLADVALAEIGVDDHGKAFRGSDDLCRLVGAEKVARVHGVEHVARELACKRARLLATAVIERRICVTLEAAVAIPIRLAVPREDQGRHPG